MSYFGRHQLGDEIAIQVVCRNESKVPIFPTTAPTMDIWTGATKAFAGLVMFPTERYIVTGLFMLRLRLAFLALGTYNCVIRWVAGSYNGVSLATFEVVDGGDSNGTCISMVTFQPANGLFLVRQTTAGVLLQGKNPNP